MSWITVLPSHSCGGTLQNLDIKLLHSSMQTPADHRSRRRHVSRMTDEKGETWSPSRMSKVRSRPEYECLSIYHTPVLSLNSYTVISSQFINYRVAPSFQFFHTKWDCNIPTGTPLTWAPYARGMKKVTIFDRCHAISRKRCKIEPLLLWKANRKPHPSFRMYRFEWPWVTSNPDSKVMLSFNVK